jgi:uncharacterized protein (TIGR03435 family)
MAAMPPNLKACKSLTAHGVVFAVLTAGLAQVQSQVPTDSTPRFAVASVRLSAPDTQFTSFSRPGALTFTATGAPLMGLLTTAFGVPESQVLGLPGWASTARYDVAAKPEGEKPLSDEQFRAAMQQLLEERLHLAFHRETKTVEGYKLIVGKGGPRLKPSKGGWPGRTQFDKDGSYAHNVTLQDFAAGLQWVIRDFPVVDETGIKGSYEINLKFTTDEKVDSSLPSVFTAVQEQLGLKLERAKVPVDVIVIDHVDREPTEN